MNTEEGFDQLLSLETSNDASIGYLVNDCRAFGAEIFVLKPTGKWELLSMVKKPANGSLAWKIEDFSELHNGSCFSKTYEKQPLKHLLNCLSSSLSTLSPLLQKFKIQKLLNSLFHVD